MGRVLRRVLPAVLLLTVVCAEAVSSQVVRRQPPPDWRTTTTLGFGYAGNGPRALLGANLYLITPVLGGLGVYADFKTSHQSFEDEMLMADYTRQEAEDFGDLLEATHESWYVINLGLIRPVTAEFAVFGGAGYGHETLYRDYYDQGDVRGWDGHYRIEDEADGGGQVNVFGGAMFRVGRRVAFHFGGELAPPGFTVGASLPIPFR